jgi:NAD(P)H-hydrate epimerase
MRKVDDIAIKTYKITLSQMMELAGSNFATLAKRVLKQSIGESKILVLAGKGNNGGGGLVAARHLHNWGAEVICILSQRADLKPAVIHQIDILKRLKIPLHFSKTLSHNTFQKIDLILDCLLGYNAKGDPRPPLDQIIRVANKSGIEILSLDLPSGLDATSGKPGKPCIKATYTMALALLKSGLITESARKHVGKLYLADLGIPKEIYHMIGLNIGPVFSKSRIIKISG